MNASPRAAAVRLTFSAIVAAIAAVPSAGCGGSGSDAPRQLQACQLSFEATVHQGPDTGLSLKGPLELAVDGDGAFGTLTVAGMSKPIPAAALLENGQIRLRFFMPDGTAIDGTGALQGSLAQCSGMLTGSLSGPSMGDTGDWLAQSQSEVFCETHCYFQPPIPSNCDFLCNGIDGFKEGSANYESCYNTCITGPAEFECNYAGSTLTSFFEPCQQ